MTETRTDLAVAALEDLGIAEAGQAPSAEDMALAAVRVDRALADIAGRNVYPAIADTIPAEAFDALTAVCARALASAFGIAGAALAARISVAQDGERRLKALARIGQGTGAMLASDPALLPRRRR